MAGLIKKFLSRRLKQAGEEVVQEGEALGEAVKTQGKLTADWIWNNRTWIVLSLAFIAGAFAHGLGSGMFPGHVLSNPLMVLVASNLLMLGAKPIMRGSGWIAEMVKEGFPSLREVVPADNGRYELEIGQLLHWSAIGLSVGALGVTYGKGLFIEYQVHWASTLITNPHTVETLLRICFLPATLFVESPVTADSTRALLDEGLLADVWIHAYAATVVVLVIFPRGALIGLNMIKRLFLREGGSESETGAFQKNIDSGQETETMNAAQRLDEAIEQVLIYVYDERVVSRLDTYRLKGGRISQLKTDIEEIVAQTGPEVENIIGKYTGQAAGTGGVGTLGTAEDMGDAVTEAASVSIGTGIVAATATISGGIGEILGIAIISTLFGVTGPVGMLIGGAAGLVGGVVMLRKGKEKLQEKVETMDLSPVAVRMVLRKKKYAELIDNSRVEAKLELEKQLRPIFYQQ